MIGGAPDRRRRRRGARRSPLCLVVAIVTVLAAGCAEQPQQIVFDSQTTSTTSSEPEDTAATSTTTSATSTITSTDASTPTTPASNSADPPATEPPTPSTPTRTPEATPSVERATISWNGNDAYLHGANLPWINFGCDFGCGQEGGISSPWASALATNSLTRARDAGMSTVRWWLFPEVLPHITVDGFGLPTGFTPAVFEDIDAALSSAAAADIDLVFTLFAGPLDIPSLWLTNVEARTRFGDVLQQLFTRYSNHPRIATWQIMNEPEWAIWNAQIDVELVRDFVREVAERVNASTTAPVSLGSARMDGLPLWTDLGLDYLTVHWYDNMTERNQCVPCVTYSELAESIGTDLPILIGEFHMNPVDPLERLRQFRDLGYAGALAWSLLPDRTADRLDIVDTASREFATELGPS